MPADGREEGELSEEGELPEEEPTQQPQDDQNAKPPAPAPRVPLALRRRPRSHSQSPDRQQHAVPAVAQPLPPSDGPQPRGSGPNERERGVRADGKEREMLQRELEQLTADLSFQRMRNDWETVCQELRSAIKKLDKLLRRIKRKREDGVEQYPAAAALSARVHGGLKHALVICGTGLARLDDMQHATGLMTTALNYRHDVFTPAHKRELEALMRSSREFGHLMAERDRRVTATAAANGSAIPQQDQQQGQQGREQQQEQEQQQGQGQEQQQQEQEQQQLQEQEQQQLQEQEQQQQQQQEQQLVQSVEALLPPPVAPPPPPPPPPPPVQQQEQQQQQHRPSSKRGTPEILDLELGADDAAPSGGAGSGTASSDPHQAAKRAKLDSAAAPGSGGGGGASGSELQTSLQASLQALLAARRLVLVLDLDHTLLNSAKFGEIDADWEFKLEQLAADQLSRPREARDLHRLPRVAMWTKLRPGVRQFLAAAAQLAELWVYTAGSRAYADAMVELLDPAGQYFGQRVIAQAPAAEDAPGDAAIVVKRLTAGLAGREPLAVILDDSSSVWPADRPNLLVIERYMYFPSSRRRLGMAGRSLLEVDRDECARRGMLSTALRVVQSLHADVFSRLRAGGGPGPSSPMSWDVRSVMFEERQRVLSGVAITFSRIIPLETDPRGHPLWQLAEQFGAACIEGCSDAVTHVIATHGGTEKVMWARQSGRHVVSPAWLECSCILWQRASEERFPAPI